MRVALVSDYLNQYGGAERVLEALCALFPSAPIYTLFYDAPSTGFVFEGRDIRTSFLQKIPFVRKHHRYFPMLMPMAIEQFDLSSFDLVISSSASYAKGVITNPGTYHICYCHTPLRYAWGGDGQRLEHKAYPFWMRAAIPLMLPYLRVWDRQASTRPDVIIANSHFVQEKIAKYYRRESRLVYPPVNIEKFSIQKPDGYFLIVGRMVPYKHFDIAVEACTRLNLPLKIIGDGPQRKILQRIAGSTVQFEGLVHEKNLPLYYANARALLFPQEEDFGITAIESMASGRPVIAYRKGGALEYIREGENGIFFNEQTVDSLAGALQRFEDVSFDPVKIRASAERYDARHFFEEIKNIIGDTTP